MIYVMIGGFFGAIIRFIVSKKLSTIHKGFPFPTFIVNIVGAFLLGLVIANEVADTLYQLVGIGFLGAFTTFSTYSYETLQLVKARQFGLASFYWIGSVLLGVGAFFIALLIS
ncbi:fluoride efflux transporter CrcB [Lysinibacillus sp. LZ02]|uniref:fluoride efflux transporter CrcB n=1 Tax=Lysinibacillus sp. LZ02 TaxID=3420668 RepID=UPI003D3687B0